MGNGNGRRQTAAERVGLNSSTTLPISLVAIVLAAVAGGAWWAAIISGSVQSLASTVQRLDTSLTKVSDDLTSIKTDIKIDQGIRRQNESRGDIIIKKDGK